MAVLSDSGAEPHLHLYWFSVGARRPRRHRRRDPSCCMQRDCFDVETGRMLAPGEVLVTR